MKRVVIALAAVASVGVLLAQEPVDREMVARIKEEGLKRGQAARLFEVLTTDIGPRLTGSPAYKRAADWARETMAGWGLQNPRLEAWEFGRGWTLERLTLEMIEPRYVPLIGYADAWSPPTPGDVVAAPILLANTPIEQVEQMRGRLKGAIVLTQPIVTAFIREDRAQPTDPNVPAGPPVAPAPAAVQAGRGRGRSTALAASGDRLTPILQESGIAALIRPSRGEHGTVFVTGRDAPDAPYARVLLAGEHYNMIVRLLERGASVRLRVNVQSRFLDQDRLGYNVLAEIPGTDARLRDEVVMLGAHLDSWHTGAGATDNADGSAAAMEAMRILQAIGARPKRTIRLALWGGEEQGLLGSRRYVERYLAGDANKAARDRLYVYFNIDPGTGPIYGFYLEGHEGVRAIFDAWLEPFKELGARRNVMQGIGSTDHLSFIRAGMLGFNPVQDYVDYDVRTHHTNVDTPERVRPADIQQGAIILASFAYHAAMRDGRLPVAAVGTRQ